MSFLLKDDLTEWENQEDVTDICESDADCPLSQYCLPCVTILEECQNCPNRYWIPETQQCAVCPEGTRQDVTGTACVSE